MSNTIDLSDHRDHRRLWLVLAGWTASALMMALILSGQSGLAFIHAFEGTLFYYYVLGVLVWLACRADARFTWWKQPPLRALSIHAALGVAAISLWTALQLGYMRFMLGPDYWALVYSYTWGYQLQTAALAYAAGLGLGLTVQSFDRERERQRREAQLEVTAREAELAAIKAQLQPHFLLNALNSILVLIEQNPPEARAMVTRLASLLHSVFDRLDEPLVSLDRELDTIRDYLEIERIRFGDRLDFSIQAEQEARHVPVPPFLLQPLVENAVKHGVEPYTRPGGVRVTACVHGSRLRVTIADTGDGFDGGGAPGTGRGLELTRRRLHAVYGNGAGTLRAGRHADGFAIELDLPVQPDAD